MIDVSVSNSFVIFTAINPDWMSGRTHKRRLFLEELGRDMVSAKIMTRVHLPSAPSAASMVQEMQGSLAEGAPITAPPTKRKRSRCWMCPNKKRIIDICCIRCNKYTCKDHRFACCKSCWINGTITIDPDAEETT